MTQSKKYNKNKKDKENTLQPKEDLIGEDLAVRGTDIINRLKKNKGSRFTVAGVIPETSSYLSDKYTKDDESFNGSEEQKKDSDQNKTENFSLSDALLDNKLKDHKIESDRYLHDEIGKINSKVDKSVGDFPRWAIGTILIVIGIIAGVYFHLDSKFDTLKDNFSTFKKTIEQKIDTITAKSHKK